MKRRTSLSVMGVAALALGSAAVLPLTASAAPSAGPTIHVQKVSHGWISTLHTSNSEIKVFSTSGPVKGITGGQVTKKQVTSKKTVNGITSQVNTTVSGTGGELQLADPGKSLTTIPTVSVVDELTALGEPLSSVQQWSSFDTGPTSTTTTSATRSGGVQPLSSPVNNDQLRSSLCIDVWYDGDASQHRVHEYGCGNQYLVWQSSTTPGLWGLEDKFFGTGISKDSAIFNPDEISGVKFGVHYGAYNQINWYQPQNTYYDSGSCYDKSWSVTYKDWTVSTDGGQVCKAWFGPDDFDYTHFATKWNGNGTGYGPGIARTAAGADSVYDPPNASANRSVYWYMWWV